MILFCFALLCGLVQGQDAPTEDFTPDFYTVGTCAHPVAAVPGHQKPLQDDAITIAVSLSDDNDTDQAVEAWIPEAIYQVTVTSETEMELLVGVNGGMLEIVDEGAVDCDGVMWYTKSLETEHAVSWKAPACCEFGGNEAQIFVTGSRHDGDFLRQQQAFVTGDLSSCDCADESTPPEPNTVSLPVDKADLASETHISVGEEPDEMIKTGEGEIDPNALGDGDQAAAASTESQEKKPSSSFGYAFLIMLLTICIALSAVWFYRKYRVRQMQYREFEGLEMRGYAQWSDAAGL